MMNAAVIYENGAPSVLRYKEIPDPTCTPGSVLIEVEAIGIEGGDLLARASTPLPKIPHVVGYLCAGRVIETGSGVNAPKVGDRVVTLDTAGSHAAKRVVPAPMTWPIPDGLPPQVAACISVAFGTAQECLFMAGELKAGQAVLIHAGAGGVGMAAIQLAKQAKATVLSTASSDEKLERLRAFGLDHGVNYVQENFVERVLSLTDGRGVDLVLDSVGGATLLDSIKALAYRGTLVSVGVAARAGSDVSAMALWTKNSSLRGVYLGGALANEYDRVHRMVAKLIQRVARGELKVEIDRVFRLEDASAAHAYAESRGAFGRVVMTP